MVPSPSIVSGKYIWILYTNTNNCGNHYARVWQHHLALTAYYISYCRRGRIAHQMDYQRTMQRYREQIERTNQKIRQYEAMSLKPRQQLLGNVQSGNHYFSPQEVAILSTKNQYIGIQRDQRAASEPSEAYTRMQSSQHRLPT